MNSEASTNLINNVRRGSSSYLYNQVPYQVVNQAQYKGSEKIRYLSNIAQSNSNINLIPNSK